MWKEHHSHPWTEEPASSTEANSAKIMTQKTGGLPPHPPRHKPDAPPVPNAPTNHLLAQEQKARMTAAGELGRTAAEAFCLGKGSRRAVLDPEPPALGTEINLFCLHSHVNIRLQACVTAKPLCRLLSLPLSWTEQCYDWGRVQFSFFTPWKANKTFQWGKMNLTYHTTKS